MRGSVVLLIIQDNEVFGFFGRLLALGASRLSLRIVAPLLGLWLPHSRRALWRRHERHEG